MSALTELKQVSMYAINKTSQDEAFNESLDNSEVTDTTLSDFVNKIFEKGRASSEDMREVVFLPGSYVKNCIVAMLTELKDDIFKLKTFEIAEKLFSVTQMNYKKGDLVSAIYLTPSKYIVFLCKVDENQYMKRGPENKWIIDAGINREIKLQKAAYINIDLTDINDYTKWKITTIDKIASDAQYWNNRFIEAQFKRDNKTNSKGFDAFFSTYIKELPTPDEQFRAKRQYLHYTHNNKSFELTKFLDAIFGDSDKNKHHREALASAIENAANEQKFDMAFSFDTSVLNRKSGKFIIDDKIKIEYTKSIDSEDAATDMLKSKIQIRNDSGDEFMEPDGRKFAKVYYNHIEYKQ